MFSEKKKREVLPDLPPVKSPFSFSADASYSGEEGHSLPSFPDSLNQSGFSQAAIKDAVGNGESISPPPSERKDTNVIEMEEWNPSTSEEHSATPQQMSSGIGRNPNYNGMRQITSQVQFPEISERMMPPPVNSVIPNNAPKGLDVFVKIDKFHSAKKTLKEVKGKLNEIDSLIKKIRETKMREEQEIASWEKDLTFAKTRIQEISDNIFDKVG